MSSQEPNATSLNDGKEARVSIADNLTKSENGAGGECSSPAPKLSFMRLSLLLLVLWVGISFPILDETMIATLLGPISTTFNSFSNLSWIATTYLIGMSSIVPATGHLTDIFGRRSGLIIVNIVFIAGTLICGLSPQLWVLLLGRSIQGIGGGAMCSITSFIEADLVPLRSRGITEGLGGVVYGVAIAVGGLFGGGINDTIGWKWAFLVQVPIVTVVSLAAWFLIDIPKNKSADSSWERVDFVGAAAIIGAIVFLQLGLDSGGNTHSWKSALVLVSLPVSVTLFALFFVWDFWYAKEPLIPLRLLGQRNILFSNLFYLLSLMSYFSIEFYVPIYLQTLGHSTTATGLRFLPQAVGAAAALLIAGFVIKITGKYYWINVAAQIFSILGSGLLLTLKTTSPAWYVFVFLGLTGIGFGASWVTVLMGALSSVPDDKQAVILSANFCARTIGMTLGLTFATSIFQRYLQTGLLTAFSGYPGEDSLVKTLRKDFHALKDLNQVDRIKGQHAYMNAIHLVFWLTTAESLVAGLVSVFITENELSDGGEN